MNKEERKQLVKEVRKEILNIKTNAKYNEIEKLDFNTFIFDSAGSCIYGQMTGSCNSLRAKEISPKLYFYLRMNDSLMEGSNYTALEKYLTIVKPVTHKKIIDYIKGDITTLKIS